MGVSLASELWVFTGNWRKKKGERLSEFRLGTGKGVNCLIAIVWEGLKCKHTMKSLIAHQ